MQPDWSIQRGENGINTISHDGMDSFTAHWTTGDKVKPHSEGEMHWTHYATGEDNIQLFDFIWNDDPPRGEEFRELMKSAANVIDEWIASRL